MSGIRHFARDVYAQALYACGASRLNKIPPGRLLILMLHRVLPLSLRARYPLPGLAVTPEELRWVLACISRHFKVATVSQALDVLHEGGERKPLLALSFDDGQLDNLEHGVPILDEFGIKASFYVPTDFIGTDRLLWHDAAAFGWAQLMQQPGECQSFLREFPVLTGFGKTRSLDVDGFLAAMKAAGTTARAEILSALEARSETTTPEWARLMSWDEVRQLRDAGHEIGAHSRTHELLPHLDPAAQEDEVCGSARAIEESLGEAPRSFCYPNGSYDEHTLAAVEKAGYDNAVTTRWGVNDLRSGGFELLRCDLSASSLVDRRGLLSLPRLSLRLSGFQPGLRRYDGRLPESA